jgi:hypothetical protein
MDGVMVEPEDPPDILDQGQWWTVLCVGVGHKKSLYWRLRIVDNIAQAKEPENPFTTNIIIAKRPGIVEASKTA